MYNDRSNEYVKVAKAMNVKNVKNTHGGVLHLVKLNITFTKSSTPPWVFFTFFKLRKWYKSRKASHIHVKCAIASCEAIF